MAAISGKTGLVNGACNEIKSWSVTLTTDMLDATDFCSSGWREFIEGLKGGTGEITSTERYDTAAISNLILANSEGGVTITGDCKWHEETITNVVDGIQEYTQGFTFTGAVTIS